MKYPPAPQSKCLLDMEVANYCEGLDPSYSTLGFENAEVLYGGGGKCKCVDFLYTCNANTKIHTENKHLLNCCPY